MPRLVDYSVRFELMREAVVRIAARDGGTGVTLAAVAAELHVSTSTLRRTLDSPEVLPEIGVVWLARQRQYRRFTRGLPLRLERGSVDHAQWLLWGELPSSEEQVDQARAWSELTMGGTSGRVATLRQELELFLDEMVAQIIAFLGVPECDLEIERVRARALLDGLTAGACRRSVTTEQMRAALDLHLDELVARFDLAVRPGASGSPR